VVLVMSLQLSAPPRDISLFLVLLLVSIALQDHTALVDRTSLIALRVTSAQSDQMNLLQTLTTPLWVESAQFSTIAQQVIRNHWFALMVLSRERSVELIVISAHPATPARLVSKRSALNTRFATRLSPSITHLERLAKAALT
jgi:hypothetical protein